MTGNAGARGLYRQADVLIADEPTAALDAHTEARAFEAIRAQARETGSAVVLITHRMSSVRMADHVFVLHGRPRVRPPWPTTCSSSMADHVFVLDHGRLVEQGTHTQLIERGGLYADMYTTQARSYQEAPLTSTGTINPGISERAPSTTSNTESH